jgi:hypothetical protein
MNVASDTLPDDPVLLKNIILQQQQLLSQKQQQIEQLLEQFRLQRHRQFGASSEQAPGQGHLFNEVEILASEALDDTAEETPVCTDETKRPARGHRRPLPAELPRLDVIHDLAEADKQCACGCQRHLIGEVVSEQLDIIPAQVRVLCHRRQKYACAHCESGTPCAKPTATASVNCDLNGVTCHRALVSLKNRFIDKSFLISRSQAC